MRFLHLSDTHLRRDYQRDWFTRQLFHSEFNPSINLEEFLKNLNKNSFDFVLITGDLVHEGKEEDYQLFTSLWDKYVPGLPYFFCRGNHDVRQNFFKGLGLEANPSMTYTSCGEIDGLRIISLDSAQDDSHEGKISEDQLELLRSYLATPSEKGSILLLHHPLAWEEEHVQTQVPEGFADCIRESDIKAIFVGHIHTSSVLSYAGKPQIMAESMAFGTDEYPDESIFLNRTGYNIVSLEGDRVSVYPRYLSPSQSVIGQLDKPFDNAIFSNDDEEKD